MKNCRDFPEAAQRLIGHLKAINGHCYFYQIQDKRRAQMFMRCAKSQGILQ